MRFPAAALAVVLAISLAGAARGGDEPDAAPPSKKVALAHIQDISSVNSSGGRPPGIFGALNAPPVHVEISLDHAFHTSFTDFSGSFHFERDRVLVGTWAPLPGTFLFGLDLEAEASTYRGSWGLVFGNDHLDRTLWQIDVGPKILDNVTDRVALYLGTVFFFCGDLEAEVQDSFRFEVDLATQIKITPEIILTAGAGVRTGLETRPTYYPILGLELPGLKFFLAGGILKATKTVVANVTGIRELDVFGSFGYDHREYRLDDKDGRGLFALPGGILRDTLYPLTVGMTWKPITGIGLDFSGGANFWQKIEVDDHLGRALARGHANPAPFVAFQLVIDI